MPRSSQGPNMQELTSRRGVVGKLARLGAPALGLWVAGGCGVPLSVAGRPKVRHIGFLMGELSGVPVMAGFVDELRARGWVEGQNLVVEWRDGEGRIDRYPALAAELVRAQE